MQYVLSSLIGIPIFPFTRNYTFLFSLLYMIQYGHTMLTLASHFDHTAVLTFLLASGADKEAKSYVSSTLLPN